MFGLDLIKGSPLAESLKLADFRFSGGVKGLKLVA